MHQKVTANLDENLVRRARLESIRQSRTFDEILQEALELYLEGRAPGAGIVARTWAVLPVERNKLREILEEDSFLDA